MSRLVWVMRLLLKLVPALLVLNLQAAPVSSPYSAWSHGPPSDPSYFPIAVWLQSPVNASRYRAAFINTYVGLWKGPTEEQLVALKQVGMRLICEQNQVALRHKDDEIIVGWMHGDEPDNAQPNPGKSDYGPPVKPDEIVAHYRQLRAVDPTRPVLLNLGQGVAWEKYYGRGVRTGHLEDYPEYIKGCDIVSFDIYPVVHEHPEVAGRLDYIARGVERLAHWADGKQIVWNCLECTHISNASRKATPAQVRSEAWMSLIHGSRGLIYFVHEFQPKFREAALLDDAEMLAGVTQINKEIQALAPVLNSPTAGDEVAVLSKDQDVPVAAMVKVHEGKLYLFAICMRERGTVSTFTLKQASQSITAEVLNEGRSIALQSAGKSFEDKFGPWEVHLYRLTK